MASPPFLLLSEFGSWRLSVSIFSRFDYKTPPPPSFPVLMYQDPTLHKQRHERYLHFRALRTCVPDAGPASPAPEALPRLRPGDADSAGQAGQSPAARAGQAGQSPAARAVSNPGAHSRGQGAAQAGDGILGLEALSGQRPSRRKAAVGGAILRRSGSVQSEPDATVFESDSATTATADEKEAAMCEAMWAQFVMAGRRPGDFLDEMQTRLAPAVRVSSSTNAWFNRLQTIEF